MYGTAWNVRTAVGFLTRLHTIFAVCVLRTDNPTKLIVWRKQNETQQSQTLEMNLH